MSSELTTDRRGFLKTVAAATAISAETEPAESTKHAGTLRRSEPWPERPGAKRQERE